MVVWDGVVVRCCHPKLVEPRLDRCMGCCSVHDAGWDSAMVIPG